jgi:hypothetical protein
MTCFWDGIISSLNNEDFKLLNLKQKPNPLQLIVSLQKHNKQTNNITWQGNSLSKKEKKENFTHVKEFNYKNINSGYLCSTSDPFLFLIAEILQVNVEHYYLNNKIKYKNKNKNKIRKTLYFKSSRGHFQKK